MNAALLEGIEQSLKESSALAETHRRERHGAFTTVPIEGIMDYSTAAQAVQAGIAILNESIPNGQFNRTMAALSLVMVGSTHLTQWINAATLRAYELDPLAALTPEAYKRLVGMKPGTIEVRTTTRHGLKYGEAPLL